MNESILKELYQKRGVPTASIDAAIQACIMFEAAMQEATLSFETVTVGFIRNYMKKLINQGENDLGTIVALARYFLLIGRNEIGRASCRERV